MTPGQLAYEGYVNHCGGLMMYSNDKFPPWTDLPASVKAAWEASASAVAPALLARIVQAIRDVHGFGARETWDTDQQMLLLAEKLTK